MSEKPLRFMKSIEKLPGKCRGRGSSVYDEILREFVYSGAKYAEVKDMGKKPLSVLVGIKNRLKARYANINVCMRGGKIYLQKLDRQQQAQLTGSPIKTYAMSSSKIEFDVSTILNSAIVKAKCPHCLALNTKDSRVCRDCRHELYSTEQEYQNTLKEMTTLETTLNSH